MRTIVACWILLVVSAPSTKPCAAAAPTTAPAVPFDGTIELVRGGTLHLAGIGSNPTTRPVWWSIDGSPIAAPKHSTAPNDSNEALADFAASLGEALRPAELTRQVAWRQEERPGEENNEARATIVRPYAMVGVINKIEFGLRKGIGTKRYSQYIFQPYPEQDAQPFDAEGKQEDRRWQTFAVFTPGGPTRAGPIAFEIGQDDGGTATIKMDYNFDWPVRFVAIVKPGLRLENPGTGGSFHQGDRHSTSQTFSIVPIDELLAVHVQLCGVQTFTIRGLPMNPGATTRPATILNEHRRPSVPGFEPMDVALPPAMPARWQLALMKWHRDEREKREQAAAATRPATTMPAE